MTQRLWLFLFCVIALSGLFSGCISTEKTKATTQVHKADVLGHPYQELQIPIPEEGSLWTDASGAALFRDQRAHQVGDLVTVRVSEKPTGELSAETETSRDSSISAGIPNFLGIMETYGQNHSLDPENLFTANFNPSFKGEGTNERSGEMDAYVTARVIQVMANGNLRIWGKQEIQINNETQYISVSGIIRPEDVSTDNQIQSTYIADARILYSGIGDIADKQKPGWLMRTLDHIWPF